MQDISSFLDRYKIWNFHLEKVCMDIGSASIQFKPMPESNSAAWLLIHLVNHYHDFLSLSTDEKLTDIIKEFPVPDEKDLIKMSFSNIFSLTQEYRQIFLDEVKRLDKFDLIDTIVPAGEDKTWMDLVFAVINHEIYHCGQLAYIARIIQQKASSDTHGIQQNRYSQ